MEQVIKINDKVSVEVKKVKGRTIVILDRNGERLVLANKVINEGFSCDVEYDDNYVVVYSKGSMMNQIPLIIECAYSIKNDAILNTKKNKKLAYDLEMMLISKRLFNVITIILWLNDKVDDLQSIDDIYDFVVYLNNGNENISRDKMIPYVLKEYPKLEKYLNIKELDCEKTIEDFGGEYLSFHKMPQIVDTEDDRVQALNVLVTRKKEPYVISEELLQPTDPSKKNEVNEMAQEFRRNNLVRTRRRYIPTR